MKATYSNWRGLFARGTADECPQTHLLESINFMSKGSLLTPRPGWNQIENSKVGVVKMGIFSPLPVAGVLSPKLILHNGSGIFNNSDFPGAAIFPSGVANYHSWINFFGRGYFTLHDTIIGSSAATALGLGLLVYEGGATSRAALGLKPTSSMAGVGAGGGNLGVGTYLIDVAYVTASGYITKPSGSVVAVNAFGGYVINLNTIPTGPLGTVARRIVVTKAIPLGTYTGNPDDYEFFFEPNGLINDNVTTTFAVNFFDGDLSASADYLFDQLETISAGLGIGSFEGRMLLWGQSDNPSVIRVSEPGEPEAFSAIDGVIVVDPTESGGVTNCIEHRGTLYICKSHRMFVTADNGGPPSSWPVKQFDSGIGTEVYGISAVLDAKGNHLNQFLMAARNGIYLFDGIVRTPELTYWIKDVWEDIDPAQFSKVQLFLNPLDKHIYCVIPRNSGSWQILFGDYSDGLSAENIKWHLWQSVIGSVDGAVKSMTIGVANGRASVSLALPLAVVNFTPPAPINHDDTGALTDQTFNCTLKTPVLKSPPDDEYIHEVHSVVVRQKGGDDNDFTLQGIREEDTSIVESTYTIPFVVSSTKIQTVGVDVPFVADLPSIKLTTNSSRRPLISRIVVEGDTYGEQ